MVASSWKSVAVYAVALVVVASAFGLVGIGAAALSPASPASPALTTTSSAAVAPTTTSVVSSAASSAPSNTIVTPSASSNPAAGIQFGTSTARETAVNAAYEATIASGEPISLFEPPNLNVAPPVTETQDHIVPLYAGAPAPLGIGVFGLENTTGTTTPYIYRTTSVLGTFTTSDPLGVQTTSPYFSSLQAYGAQLNLVLVNATVGHTDNLSYWLQNVINYNPTTDSLSVENNIWNFSNVAFDFPSSGILHGSGSVLDSEYYATSGPSITIAYPFTLDLYVNTTVGSYDGSPLVNEVYFNYSLYNGAGQHVCPTPTTKLPTCGTYDNVYFNSKQAVAPGSAQIEANGFQYNGAGLDTDMEMDWGIGTSSGATASINYANAQLGIAALNTTVAGCDVAQSLIPTSCFVAPPSAYDFGSDTGETGLGGYGTWSYASNGQPVEQYRTGPSLLVGLWNASGGPTLSNTGAYAINYGSITPGNAFVAVAYGASVTNQSYFSVAPTFGWFSGKGTIAKNLYLQPGTYTVEVILSGYDEVTQNVVITSGSATPTISLVKDPASTVYTPLWAFTNQDLANLSVSGAGTSVSPYVIDSTQQGNASLEPVFATLNDYLFIVWSGIWLNGTTAYVQFNPAPTLFLAYPEWWISTLDKFGPTPLTQQLPMYFYHAQNVAVAHASGIGGWSSSNGYPGRAYAVYVNDGQNILFYQDVFNVSSEGLEFLSGGSHNYVWGSTFESYTNAAYTGIETPTTGLTVSESGDHIYNNKFFTNGTAASSTSYTNFWNATGGYQSATNSITVDGFALTGSILGQSIQGGNYWFNYGTVANPYGVPYVARATSPTGTASIGKGADYAPLSLNTTVANGATVPSALGTGLYAATFTESGLESSSSWELRVSHVPVYQPAPLGTTTYSSPTNTTVVSTAGPTNTFYLPNGTYAWTLVTKPTGSVSSISGGTITVYGSTVAVAIAFQWTVTVSETGLTTGLEWAATFNGKLVTSTTSSIVFDAAPGTYGYSASAVPAGWIATPSSGSSTVAGATTIAIVFSASSAATYTVYFTQSGLASGTEWSVTFNGHTTSATTATISFSVASGGPYSYSIGAIAGYTSTPSSGTVTVSGAPVSLGITFTPVTCTVTFTESGLPGATAWALVFGGVLHWSTGTTITFQVTSGTYGWQIAYISGYTTGTPTGTQDVTGTVGITIVFT